MNKKILLISIVILGLTGCTNSRPKPFEYKEWHNVQTNEYGQKCTYREPKKTEIEQKWQDGIMSIIGPPIRAVFDDEEKCLTLSEWRGVAQGAAAMAGLLGTISSLKSISAMPPSINSSLPPSNYGLSTWNSTSPPMNSNTPLWNPIPPSGYKSSYDTTYQYDLSNPLDRVRYNSDPGAQLRDRITPNPYKDIEQNINQQGGGVYPTDNSTTWTPIE